MEECNKDPRFSHILKDARFKKIPQKQVKIKIDKRFQSMFNDSKFQVKYNIDKRGRSVKVESSEDLKRYYAISDDSGDEEEEKKINKNVSISVGKEDVKIETKKIAEISKKESDILTPDIKQKLKDLTTDYARGEGAIFTDSSSSEEDSSESEDIDKFEINHEWGELDKDAGETDEATNRLAVCNMNWDRIEASDLMVLFSSFLPPGGLIHSVTIYPSDFGAQRMKEEEEKGPIELTEDLPKGKEEELNQIQMEKLRKYQLNRLRYYYAVVVCDTVETADFLYKECDGLEYESSSSKLDLRFIPNEMSFDQEPRESCTSLPDLSNYKPRLFTTSALTKAKVDLTWDETDPNREEIVKSIHTGKIDENHLKKYLAYSSSSEESENEEKTNDVKVNLDAKIGMGDVDKYKALLADIESKEINNEKNKINLEVSWNLKLENKANEIVQGVVKEKNKTPFQQYLEKRKEKKKNRRKEKKELLGKEGSDDSAFSDDEIPSDIDLNDSYFKEEFQESKSTNKKKKKKKNSNDEVNVETKQKQAELELLLLENEEESKHFNLKKIKEGENTKKNKKRKKRRIKEETNGYVDDFKIDVKDERFSALYTSHHFNIDPADPQFRETKATRELIQEKLRRREAQDVESTNEEQLGKEDSMGKRKRTEMSVLVRNIKKNTTKVKNK